MPRRISLPRICIALGFSETETLLAHARKEYDAGERFFEFRIDYLPSPEQGVAAIRKFLSRHADCTILATCRRHRTAENSTAAWSSRCACSKPPSRQAPRPSISRSKAPRTAWIGWNRCARRRTCWCLITITAGLRRWIRSCGAWRACRPTDIKSSPRRASRPTIIACWRWRRASEDADGAAGHG